ncbi:hypothetical protein QWZ16_24440 [Vibrio ostreicida]|uniref:Uncharacterized protein n=1 Tax=Vibrio ostreicida TaxID=526588 RepID=A0ABT8BXB2_9VIBR|nr:hypothetical protein [Vibrio ostreicida]MDN3610043.1 hypothetical protein [Vibrio ostreicida]MDN3611643.1 hypothetical protein [Vibrio ostreicida]MDN3611650.1 hypothetical protein [Vibrio ostreicida]MDN3612703.1 hypothetical protein [Vibrio ostreicida]MDN3612720.1 hypothetical protein [Vibrio ostreicida]
MRIIRHYVTGLNYKAVLTQSMYAASGDNEPFAHPPFAASRASVLAQWY